MEVSKFEEIQAEFMQRVIKAVYCSMATVDRKSRPPSFTDYASNLGWFDRLGNFVAGVS